MGIRPRLMKYKIWFLIIEIRISAFIKLAMNNYLFRAKFFPRLMIQLITKYTFPAQTIYIMNSWNKNIILLN